MPSVTDQEKSIAIKWEELVMMLEGISLKSVQRRKRYPCRRIGRLVNKSEKQTSFCWQKMYRKCYMKIALAVFLRHASGNTGNES